LSLAPVRPARLSRARCFSELKKEGEAPAAGENKAAVGDVGARELELTTARCTGGGGEAEDSTRPPLPLASRGLGEDASAAGECTKEEEEARAGVTGVLVAAVELPSFGSLAPFAAQMCRLRQRRRRRRRRAGRWHPSHRR